MASMPEKKVFRARVLDPNKRLEVRIRQKCRQQSPKVKRAVAVPPSGMEKEEEMESHLQQAIFAQKASSAGASVENHVIPTPKVYAIDPTEYQKTYKAKACRAKKLIEFRDFVSFFLNQSVYDADSEDEEWLRAKENICIDYFEQIIVKLEMASHSADAIIQPMEAKALLQRYNSQIIDDVYDYWLQKRKQAASRGSKYGSVLIPRLNTDGNILRREEKATINPYIAFRKRLDKVQTRKKQKTEIQTYEKILRLNYALKRSVAIAETIKLREKTKLALVDYNEDIFTYQYTIGDDQNKELDRILTVLQPNFRIPDLPNIVRPGSTIYSSKKRLNSGGYSPSVFENGATINKNIKYSPNSLSTLETKQKSKFSRYKVGMSDATDPLNIVNDSWIKRNFELWNCILPTVSSNASTDNSITLNSVLNDVGGSSGVYSLSETQKLAKIDINSSVDGLYKFSRKAGCRYRSSNSTLSNCVNRKNSFSTATRIVSSSCLLNAWNKLTASLKTESCSSESYETPSYIKVELDAKNEFIAFNPYLLNDSHRTNPGKSRITLWPPTKWTENLTNISHSNEDTLKTGLNVVEKQQQQTLRLGRRRIGRGGRVIFDLNF